MGVIMSKLRKIISKMFLGKSRNLNDYKEIDYETLKHYAKTDKNVVIVDVRICRKETSFSNKYSTL